MRLANGEEAMKKWAKYQLRSPIFRGFGPDECKPNRHYETDEVGEPNEFDIGFTEPFSVLLTPRKRKTL